jgi:hypothetical protein
MTVADHVVPAGHVGAYAKTLVAATVDTVTFTGSDLPEVRVYTDGTAAIYVSFGDSAAPTVAGTHCWLVPAVAGSLVLPVRKTGATVAKLISAGTPTYSVAKT